MKLSEAFSQAAFSVRVWPEGKMPGSAAAEPEHAGDDSGNVLRITAVSTPEFCVFPARNPARYPVPCMIICPGGGYSILAWDKEGTEVAELIAENGMTAVVLKYRCPDNRAGAYQDALRTVRMVRFHAAEWGIDAHAIGIMGFSAGGHLALRVACKPNDRAYEPIDEIDNISARPDFTVPVYPAYLEQNGEVAPEFLPLENVPPMLVIHNYDDKRLVVGSRVFTKAVGEAGFDCTFKHYVTGGHGYGLRSTQDVKDWGRAMIFWFKEKNLI